MERRATYRKQQTFGQPDTARELIQPVGKTGVYHVKDLCIEVEILDTRFTWGQTQYLIKPVSGYGTQWVASGLTLND